MAHDPVMAALKSVQSIIEDTYAHDDDGDRTDEDNPTSPNDTVEALMGIEGEIDEAIATLRKRNRKKRKKR